MQSVDRHAVPSGTPMCTAEDAPPNDEAVETSSDDDSGYSSYDGSIKSQLLFMHGRTYYCHGFRADSYLCPNDEQEQNRLDLQHEAFHWLFRGKLYFAPLSLGDGPKRVLDVGTGTGIWAISIADDCPISEVTGIDLSPIQPKFIPPNLEFRIDDARDTWVYPWQFDYIHTRATLHMGCWSNFQKEVIQQAFENLVPGGWFESQEVVSLAKSDDATLSPESGLSRWNSELNAAGDIVGFPRDQAQHLAKWYREVGFSDVQQIIFKVPLGGWASDPELKRAGQYWAMNILHALSGLSVRLFDVAFGRTKLESEVSLDQVRNDINDSNIHAYSEILVVFGRKPFPAETTVQDAAEEGAVVSHASGISKGQGAAISESLLPLISTSKPDLGSSPEEDIKALEFSHSNLPPYCQSSTAGYGSSFENSIDTTSITDESTDNDDIKTACMDQQSQAIIDQVTKALCQFLDTKLLAGILVASRFDAPLSDAAGQSPTESSRTQSGSRMEDCGSDQQPVVSKKRPSSERRGGKEDNDEWDRDSRRTRRRTSQSSGEPAAKARFACPYYKRNRRKYSKWTSCPGPGWEQVHRVKGHLYRRHALPLQCPRCWETCNTDAMLRTHLQQDPPCAVQENLTILEGFTKEQEKQLRSRRKPRADIGEEDKWREVYKILFPDDDPKWMPTPYYDDETLTNDPANDGLDDYAVFLRREMPHLVRQELEAMFQTEFHDVETSVRPRVEQIILEMQPRLLRHYREALMTSESALGHTKDEAQPDGVQHNADGILPNTSANEASEIYEDCSMDEQVWDEGQLGAEPTKQPDWLADIDFGMLLDWS